MPSAQHHRPSLFPADFLAMTNSTGLSTVKLIDSASRAERKQFVDSL
jgi:hypothetical protein